MTTKNADRPAATGPLAGVKILDLSTVVLGPYAGQIMGDLGAEVIRVESPAADVTRWSGNAKNPGFGNMFMTCNRNKRSLCLDLKKESAKAVLRRLIADTDVFLHNIRRAAIERLGFGYEDVSAIKPDIVYVHAVGFGSDGPYAGMPAYDDLIQAAGGSATLNAFVDGHDDPSLIPSLIADKTSGLHCAYALLAALFHRERTGEGQFVEVPMLESFVSFLMIEHIADQVWEPPRGGYGYHRVISANRKPYRTKDGFIYIMPFSPQNWAYLMSMGAGMAEDDPRIIDQAAIIANISELAALLHEITLQKTSQEWLELLSEAGVPVMRVNDIADLRDDPHLKAVEMFQRRSHPREGDYYIAKPPVKFSASPASVRREPPGVGEHNREILMEAGFTESEIDAMEAERALFSM